MASKHGSGRPSIQDRLSELKKQLEDDFRKPHQRNRQELEREIESFYQRAERAARKTRGRLGRNIDYELNGKVGQRRKQALAGFLMEYQKEFGEKHPYMDLVDEFIRMDGAPFGTYGSLDHRKALQVGAAIWIIDELQRKHKLQEAGLCLTHDAEEFMEAEIPDIYVPRVSEELLRSMLYAIWHRNDGAGKKRGREADQWDILTDEAAQRREPVEYTLPDRKGTEDLQELKEIYDPLNLRQRFDAIIALLSRTKINRAVERYKTAMADFTDRYIQCSEIWYKKARASADALEKQLERFDQAQQSAQSKNIMTGPLAKPPVLAQWPPAIPGPNRLADNIDDQIQWIGSAIEQHSKLLSKRDQFVLNAQMAYDGIQDISTADLLGKECEEILSGFEIRNPYEICFAFLYLLDSGSDLPWIHSISYAVLSKACSMLPWGQMHDVYCDIWYPEDDYDDPDEEFDPEEEEAETLTREEEQKRYEDILENPADRIEAEAEMYVQKYRRPDSLWREEHLGKVPEYCNLPQTVFESSRVVLPRDSMFSGWETADFTDSGFSEDEARIMLHLASLATEVKYHHYSWSDLLYDSYEDEEDEHEAADGQDKTPEEDIEMLKKQNRTYKAEIDRLRGQIHELAREKREAEEETRKEREINSLEHQELVDLRELIFILEHGEQEPEKQDVEISFPYETEARMIVFGGHETWLKAIRPMLPGVRFVDKDMIPKVDTIRNAKMVWIQPNAISHAYYYKIMDVARQHKIPVRYFTNASAEKCAEQLALADMSLTVTR